MQLFALAGSVSVKAARKHGDEIDLWLTDCSVTFLFTMFIDIVAMTGQDDTGRIGSSLSSYDKVTSCLLGQVAGFWSGTRPGTSQVNNQVDKYTTITTVKKSNILERNVFFRIKVFFQVAGFI